MSSSAAVPAAQVEQKSRDSAEYLEIVKKAANEYKTRERMAYTTLSASDWKIYESLREHAHKPQRWEPAAYKRLHVNIMLTLIGLKPCTLGFFGEGRELYSRIIHACLLPVIKRHGLDQYGFILEQITHPMPTEFWSAEGGFQHSWIFADTRSSKWADVKNIFLVPHPGQKTKEVEIGRVLGYPIEAESFDRHRIVRYNDRGEKDHLQGMFPGQGIVDVIGIGYFCPNNLATDGEGQFLAILEHFQICKKAAKTVGWELTLDTDGHNALDMYVKSMEHIWAMLKGSSSNGPAPV